MPIQDSNPMKNLMLLLVISWLGSVGLFASTGAGIVGQQVVISVTCDGTQPFTYQWRKNGNTIAGATAATLTLVNIVQTDAGVYTVIVSNPWGNTTSDTATLTVAVATIPPTTGTAPANAKTVLQLSVGATATTLR